MHTIDLHSMIAKLKMQPRHGRAAGDEFDAAAWDLKQKDLASRVENFSKNIPQLNNLLLEYDSILGKINTSNTQLSMGLGKVIGIQEQYATQVNSLVKNITFLEERNSALNKSYGISSVTAAKYAKQLRTIAVATEIGADKLMQYAADLKGMTSGMLFAGKEMSKFGKNLIMTQQFLQNNLKVSAAAAEGYEYYASTIADSGAEAATIHEQLSQVLASKTGLDALEIQKTLTEEIGSLSADMQLQYSRIPGSLELAVLKSKALGASIENLNSAGENLLNIEQSIGSELEYQLLSGRRLLVDGPNGKQSLTNAYRMATLQGDANKQAELMNEFIKTEGPLLEKNMFARKKAAELMGVDEATMARMLQKQKIMSELGVENLMKLNQNDIGAVVAKLRKDGVDESKIQELIKTTDTRTTAEIANDYLKSIDEKIINQTAVDVGGVRTDALAGAKGFENVMTMFSSPSMIQAFGGMSTIGETIGAITSPLNDLIDKIPGFGSAISAVVDQLIGLVPRLATAGATTVQQDALIMNDGIIKFHQDDKFMRVNDSTMIAGTNVDGNRQLARAINGGGGASIDYGKMAMAIAAAMKNVNLTVKVERDIYAPSTLNPGGRRT